jgi:hypothetical protein
MIRATRRYHVGLAERFAQNICVDASNALAISVEFWVVWWEVVVTPGPKDQYFGRHFLLV